MNNTEFIQATTRLERYYGKEYTTDQLKIMFEFLKGWNVEKYVKAINYCLRNSKYLPKIADLTSVNTDNAQVSNKENIKFVKCNKCNGEGFIKYWKTDKNGGNPILYEYLAFCNCENANSQKTINGYDLPSFEKVGI